MITAAETLAELVDEVSAEVPSILRMNVSDPGRFADLAATNLNFRIADKDEVLQRLDVGQRLRFILTRLEREVARARVMEDVKKQTEIKIEQHQREFYLRQQLRAIQSGAGRGRSRRRRTRSDLLTRDRRSAAAGEGAGQEARRETERLRMLSPASSEYQVVRTYLDWMLALPWSDELRASTRSSSSKVEEALDERHYGLDEAKERILEYLAVRKLRGGDVAGADPLLRRARRAPARRRWARRSARRSDARSTASRWAACATRPRSAAIGAPTWARCRGCCSRRCAAWR